MSLGLLRNLAALFSGVVFGLGLSMAQMTNPDKVLNFLDMTGTWDPSLLLVLGGAVVLSAVAFHFVFKRSTPLWDSMFHMPLPKAIDRPLVIGSALFGVGWDFRVTARDRRLPRWVSVIRRRCGSYPASWPVLPCSAGRITARPQTSTNDELQIYFTPLSRRRL